MREIKFRAWNGKKMIGNYDLLSGKDSDMACTLVYLLKEDIGNLEFMQYTGLKDKNGVEIYEGDIVLHSVHNVPKPIQKIIEFWEGSFIAIPHYEGSESHQSLVHFAPIRTMEIIGNIYENPELLGDR